MSERAQVIVRAGEGSDRVRGSAVTEEDAPCSPNFGIFIDTMSLFQPPYAGAVEQAFFGAALCCTATRGRRRGS